MVRRNVKIPDDFAGKLGVMAEASDQTKSEILRKALTLFEAAREGKREGKKLALVNQKDKITTEIVGL